MKKAWHASAALATALGLAAAAALSCSCAPELLPAPFKPGDLSPPSVVDWGSRAADEYLIRFDEAVRAVPGDLYGSDGVVPRELRAEDDGRSLVIVLDGSPAPGARFSLAGLAYDLAGNALGFTLPFWGHNPEPAALLINELQSVGSSTRPDAVEFYAVGAGDLAGLAFYVGLRGDYELRYVFPSRRVAAGDYVVLHLRPQGLDDERDELVAKDESAGLWALPTAWDFWYREGGGGLPDKNGALSLFTSPVGSALDAVLYSDKESAPGQKYSGFGTSALEARVKALSVLGAWDFGPEGPRPEGCARSTGATSTRTLGRPPQPADTNGPADWYVCASGGASIGSSNSSTPYTP
jgi:hypothetical protein